MQENTIFFKIRAVCFLLQFLVVLPTFAQTEVAKEKPSPIKFAEYTSKINAPKILEKVTLQDTIVSILPANDSITIVGKVKYVLHQKAAHASYYADKFTGRRTASGKIFNNNAYTCAHRKLPFGTKLRVTSERSKKVVYVTVTDRGPFVRGRHIDLSKRAFFDIAPNSGGGVIAVTVEIVKQL